MTTEYFSIAAPFLKKISRYLNFAILIVVVLVFTGWVLNNDTLKRLIPDAVAINPLTALCFLFCFIALYLQQNETKEKGSSKIARHLALSVTIIGFSKILSIVIGAEFHLDKLFFSSQLYDQARGSTNEMAPNTAICFILSGLSLFWLDKELNKRRRPAQYFSIIIMFISMLSLYGYVYGVKFLYGIAHYIPMSVITALNFLFLSLAILFSRPDKGSMAVVIGDTSAEITLLRLAAFLVPLVIGWLKLKGEKLGYFNTEFGTSLFAIVTYALALFLLGRRSVVNYRMRQIKKKAADELKMAHDRFLLFFDLSPEPKCITGLDDGRFHYINKAFESFYNINASQAIGKTSVELGLISREQRSSAINKVKDDALSKGVEVRVKNARGESRDVYINASIIDMDDMKCILTTQIDITNRKKVEEELEKKELVLNSIISALKLQMLKDNNNGNNYSLTIEKLEELHSQLDKLSAKE